MNRPSLPSASVPVILLVAGLLCAQPLAQVSAPQTPGAAALLATAMERAQAEKKPIFVEFGASWCVPCHQLRAFLRDVSWTSRIVEAHYVVVGLRVWEVGDRARLNNPGAEDLMKSYGGGSGIPFYAILDGSGKKLADANAMPDGSNIGFPENLDAINAFAELIGKTAPDMRQTDRRALVGYLLDQSTARGSAGMADRWLWSSTKGNLYGGKVSPDGRYIPFVDWWGDASGDLFLHDMITKTDLRVTRTSASGGDEYQAFSKSAFSRDSQQWAYAWGTGAGPQTHLQLRVINIRGSEIGAPRTIIDRTDVSVIDVYDWTPDSQVLATDLTRKDGTHELALVSVRDGSLRILKALGASRGSSAVFSPDGRYLAFDYVSDKSGNRNIGMLPVDGGRETSAVVHPADDVLLGWSPDGSQLVFGSDRGGASGIWLLPRREDGFGEPRLLKSDVGNLNAVGLSPSGALFHMFQRPRPTDIKILSLDFATGQLLEAPVHAIPDFSGASSRPAWSHDGKSLAYLELRRGMNGRQDARLMIRSLDNGTVRELRPPLLGLTNGRSRPWRWSSDDRAILLEGESGGRAGLYRVDVRTSEVSLVAAGEGFKQLSDDGRRAYFERYLGDNQTAVVERDVASGAEREIHRGQSGGAERLALSPDGRTIYVRQPVKTSEPPHDLIARDLGNATQRTLVRQRPLGALFLSPGGRYVLTNTKSGDGKWVLLTVPTSAGEARELRVDGSDAPMGALVWAPDESAVLIARSTSEGVWEAWWAPMDGRQPRRVGWNPQRNVELTVHPDGRRVAFVDTEPAPNDEVWVLENLFPVVGRKPGTPTVTDRTGTRDRGR